MSQFDLNTPEPDPAAYGPFDINRFTNGLGGNQEFLISRIRDGILMHTGEWKGWTPEQEMPNSHGCVHGHYTDIGIVAELLAKIGVEARKNPFGEIPYPFQSQGIVVVEQID